MVWLFWNSETEILKQKQMKQILGGLIVIGLLLATIKISMNLENTKDEKYIKWVILTFFVLTTILYYLFHLGGDELGMQGQ